LIGHCASGAILGNRRLVAEDKIERAPALEVIKRQPRQIILAALARMGEQAPAYIYLAFVFAYGTQVLHTPRDFLLTALVTAGLVSFITIPQRQTTGSGVGGAKGRGRGERKPAKHALGAGPGKRVPGAGTRTTSRKAKKEGEVHHALPPSQPTFPRFPRVLRP
jgi:hypothetical protein